MKSKLSEDDKGTFIFGTYFSTEEITEIETNPAFKNTLTKDILDLRRANENLRKSILETSFFKLLDKILKKLIK